MEITVQELIDKLKNENPNDVLYFGGLIFDRFKKRGENLLQLEFEQTVYEEPKGFVKVQN